MGVVPASHQMCVWKLYSVKWFWRRWDPDSSVHGHPYDRSVVMNHVALGITETSRVDEEYSRNHGKYLQGVIYCASLQELFLQSVSTTG